MPPKKTLRKRHPSIVQSTAHLPLSTGMENDFSAMFFQLGMCCACSSHLSPFGKTKILTSLFVLFVDHSCCCSRLCLRRGLESRLRQTSNCITSSSFPFTCHLLFIIKILTGCKGAIFSEGRGRLYRRRLLQNLIADHCMRQNLM